MDLHFGCNVMIFKNDKSDMEQILEFFTAMSAPLNDPRWQVWKSFYLSASIEMDVSFNIKQNKFADTISQIINIDAD